MTIPSWLPRRPAPVAILIGALAQALFLVRLAVPHKLMFDEVHYVPAARSFIDRAYAANIEHPPLGKELIALGIRLFGDTPVGWRFMSTLAGAATVIAVFAIVHLMTGRLRAAVVAAVLAILNFTIFVQARIAMLDGFLAAFLCAAIALMAWAMRRGGWGRWIGASAMLGAAVACKWIAAPYVLFAAIAFVVLKRGDARRWPGLPVLPALGVLGAVSIAVYFATFAPLFAFAHDPVTWRSLLPLQLDMYRRQTQVLPSHTYQSNWWTWPIMLRPIWYLYERADGAQRGVLMIGNPAVMWGGLVAVVACIGGWIGSGSPRLLAAFGLWVASLSIWALIPKSLGFYYYYYPSSIFIVIAIAAALDHWRDRLRHWDTALALAALALALYFFPVLAALALDRPDAFHHWTWLPSWV